MPERTRTSRSPRTCAAGSTAPGSGCSRRAGGTRSASRSSSFAVERWNLQPEAEDSTARRLWRQPLRPPATIGPHPVDPIVQAVLAALPELDRAGHEPVAAPVARALDLLAGEALVRLGERAQQRFAIGDRSALPRRPGAEPRSARARGEVRVRLLLGEPLDGALGPHRPMQRLPVQRDRGARVRRELAPLA